MNSMTNDTITPTKDQALQALQSLTTDGLHYVVGYLSSARPDAVLQAVESAHECSVSGLVKDPS